MTTINKNFTKQVSSKKWLYASIASAALLLGACSSNETTPTEPEPAEPDTVATVDDTQPLVEEQIDPETANTSGVTTTGEVTNVNDMDNTDQDMGSTRGEVSSLDGTDTDIDTDNGAIDDIDTDNGEVDDIDTDTDTDN